MNQGVFRSGGPRCFKRLEGLFSSTDSFGGLFFWFAELLSEMFKDFGLKVEGVDFRCMGAWRTLGLSK